MMRGANCWTDHKLVRAKLKVTVPRSAKRKEKISLHVSIHKLKIPAKRDEYREVLEQHLLARPLRAGDSTECNWDALKSCIVSAAEKIVGRGKRKQPDWFEDSEELLSPLIKAKDDAHLRIIQCTTSANRKEFRRHQRKVKIAVDNAKKEWICRVAKEGKAARKDGCTRWKSIRKLQLAHAKTNKTQCCHERKWKFDSGS